MKGSVSDVADLDRLYAAVKAERGTLDIVFANAGVGSQLALGKITAEHVDETFDTNVKGTIFTVQKALPLMGEGLADGRVRADLALAICGHRAGVDGGSAVDRPLARRALVECPSAKETPIVRPIQAIRVDPVRTSRCGLHRHRHLPGRRRLDPSLL